MNENKELEARNIAGNYFREGYNCAEAIFLTFRPQVAPELDENMVKMLTGFGGGLGQAGCTCGALIGSAMILNLIQGRTSKEEERKPAYEAVHKFHDIFKANFNSTCCRTLNKNPFGSKEHMKTCLKITGNTAKLLAEFMQEERLLD